MRSRPDPAGPRFLGARSLTGGRGVAPAKGARGCNWSGCNDHIRPRPRLLVHRLLSTVRANVRRSSAQPTSCVLAPCQIWGLDSWTLSGQACIPVSGQPHGVRADCWPRSARTTLDPGCIPPAVPGSPRWGRGGLGLGQVTLSWPEGPPGVPPGSGHTVIAHQMSAECCREFTAALRFSNVSWAVWVSSSPPLGAGPSGGGGGGLPGLAEPEFP